MNDVVLIVPPDKHELVFAPEVVAILGNMYHNKTTVYFPSTDSEGNWVYRLPSDVAEKIFALGLGLES